MPQNSIDAPNSVCVLTVKAKTMKRILSVKGLITAHGPSMTMALAPDKLAASAEISASGASAYAFSFVSKTISS